MLTESKGKLLYTELRILRTVPFYACLGSQAQKYLKDPVSLPLGVLALLSNLFPSFLGTFPTFINFCGKDITDSFSFHQSSSYSEKGEYLSKSSSKISKEELFGSSLALCQLLKSEHKVFCDQPESPVHLSCWRQRVGGPPEPHRLSRIVTEMTKRLLTKEMLGRKTSMQGTSDTLPANVSGEKLCLILFTTCHLFLLLCLHNESVQCPRLLLSQRTNI